MFLPDDVKDTVRRIYPRVAALHRGTDDERRQATKITIEQIVFEHPSQGYGWKSADPNRPPSKDAIARQFEGRLFSLDHIDGATRELKLDGEMEDITGQNFIPVSGVNHLGEPIPVDPNAHLYVGGGNDTNECDVCHRSRFDAVHVVHLSQVPHTYDGGEQDTGLCDICQKGRDAAIHTPTPQPTPSPGPDPGDDILAIVAALGTRIADLEKRVEDAQTIAEQALALAHEKQDGVARKGDVVEVEGTMSLTTAVYGRAVRWRGVIGLLPDKK